MNKNKISSLITFENEDSSTGFVNAGGNVGAQGYLRSAENKIKEYDKIRKDVMSMLEQAALILLRYNDARCITTSVCNRCLLYEENGSDRAGCYECWIYGIAIDPDSGSPIVLIDYEGNVDKTIQKFEENFNEYFDDRFISKWPLDDTFYFLNDLRVFLDFIDANPQDCQYFR